MAEPVVTERPCRHQLCCLKGFFPDLRLRISHESIYRFIYAQIARTKDYWTTPIAEAPKT